MKTTMTRKQPTKQPVKAPVKRSHTYGKQPYKPTISTILVCECGGKYIKTREGQTMCVPCMLLPQNQG